ncbi:MAG: hypothetical protein V7L23_13070 [Nostoc sp.]|uniref:hypothetical protein n=1 Tax=Nostoc sp. TaxID=1180 RepID=UPI002FF131FC
MKTPAQLLNSSAVRYQMALNSLNKFWTMDGRCKNCLHFTDIKQLVRQQMAIGKEVKILVKS